MEGLGTNTAYIERGSPWENGYIESFNACLRDELLDGEIFYSLREAQTVIESWRRHYNRIRPHAPEVVVPALAAWPACATSNGSASHAGAQASLKLTFQLDHLVGAAQFGR
jgi:putative transposase